MNKPTAPQNKLILETDRRLRDLERAYKAGGDPNAKADYRNELRRLLDMEEVPAVRCLGIFKSYGHGGDSPNMFFVGSEELAKIAIIMLDEDDGGIHFSEGGEWSASWDYKRAIAELDEVFLTSEEVHDFVMEARDS